MFIDFKAATILPQAQMPKVSKATLFACCPSLGLILRVEHNFLICEIFCCFNTTNSSHESQQ